LSARNQFRGLVDSIQHGEVMTEVVIKAGSIRVVSLISRRSARDMGLKVGDEVTAIIKATNVMIAKD
ncbi:MAG: molybdopterin-binding protein, partial [Candidatus Odinarchaeota archaeon]